MWILSRSFLPQSQHVDTGRASNSRLPAGLSGCLFKAVCTSAILSPASCAMTRLSCFHASARVSEAARCVGGCAVSWSQSEGVAWRPYRSLTGRRHSSLVEAGLTPPTCVRAELQPAQWLPRRHHHALYQTSAVGLLFGLLVTDVCRRSDSFTCETKCLLEFLLSRNTSKSGICLSN